MRSSRFEVSGRIRTRTFAALAILACALFLGAGLAAAQAKDWKKIKFPELRAFQIASPERYVMDNGIVVLLMEDHELPMVRLQAWVRTGVRLEPADKAGLASITGDVMRSGGAGARSGDEIDDWLDARGAEIETSIGDTAGTASMSCLKGDFPEVIKVFSDVLRRPRFEDQKISVSKTQEKAGIARRNDEQQGIMRREAQKLIYGAESPYVRNTEYATIDAISRGDIEQFHARYFIPNRLILGVGGDFNPGDMKKTLTGIFGDWKRGADFKDAEAAIQKKAQPGIYYIKKDDVTQSAVMMGHLGILQSDPDFYAAEVMNQVLSGLGSSRLFNNIRTEKGLAYSVRGGMSANFDYPGTFNIWLTTKTETTAASIDAMLAEVDALVAAPPTAEEMDRAKESMLASFIFNYDTRFKILNQQLALEYYHYPSDFLTTYQEKIKQVTAADVHQVAKNRVHKDELAILVVGKDEGLDRPLASFGAVKNMDITIPEPAALKGAVASVPGMSEEEARAKGMAVFAKMMAGTGDDATIDAVKNLRFVANMSVKTPQGEMQVKATRIYLLPDHIKQELQTPMGSVSMVVSPTDAFMGTPMGVQILPGSQKEDLLKSARRLQIAFLQARKDPTFSARYAGSETIEGVKCEQVTATWGGETIVFAVDAASGRLVRTSFQGRGPQGVPGEVVTFYTDYREAGGLTFPFKARQLFGGEPLTSTEILEIGVNEQIDAAQFSRPAGSAAGASSSGR